MFFEAENDAPKSDHKSLARPGASHGLYVQSWVFRGTHVWEILISILRIKCQERKQHQGNSLRDTPSCQPCSPVFGIAFGFL